MGNTENEDELKASINSEEASSLKGKQRNQGKKRKRQSSGSSDGDEIVLPDNTLEMERNVHASAVKNNLDETSVRKIIKRVVTNDHVLALVQLREEEENSGTDDKRLQPKLTRAKVKELKKVSTCKSSAWDLEKLELTPIKHIPVKTRPEVKALIAQELPEDEDDDEYEPTHDDVPSDDDHVESCSDLDSQPRTPATPATPASPRVLKDGPFKVPQDISRARRKLEIEEEEATIALRTRSKLSLSSTSIEHIESTFVPPDDIPMQDVDDLWSDFLNGCLNPASVAKNEDDDETLDETDPEYNVAADPDAHDEDEEVLSNSIIKISKKELNDLVTELFSILPETAEEELLAGDLANSVLTDNSQTNISHWEGKQEPVSDDENGKKPSQKLEFENESTSQQPKRATNNDNAENGPPKGKVNIVESEKQNAQKEKVAVPIKKRIQKISPCITIDGTERSIQISIEEGQHPSLAGGVQEAPPSLRSKIKPASQTVRIEVNSSVVMSQDQLLILQQQLRQHIQLAASNFMQTVVHPVHWKMAPQYKEYLVSLTNIVGKKADSVVNVCNLKPAYELITTWEKSVTEDTEENRKMIEFMAAEVVKSRRRISHNSLYLGDFPETFKKVVSNSPVFLYPYLLPCMPYRPDQTRRFCYLHSEDNLIVLGLDQFWPYVESNPDMFKLSRVGNPRARRGFMATVELVAKHMFPWMTATRLAGHVNASRGAAADETNPIYRYFKHNEVPKIEHTILPFNPTLTLYEQPEFEMPKIWVRYLAKHSQRFRKFIYKRSAKNVGCQPTGVQINPKIPQETVKKPLPIDFTKEIVSVRATMNEKSTKEPLTNRIDVNIKKPGEEQPSVLLVQNLYRLVETSTGAYLLPLEADTKTVNSTGLVTTPAVVTSIVANNLPENRTTRDTFNIDHCMCCELLRNICKKRQSLITEYFKGDKEKKCYCNNVSYPKISNRLKLLVRSCKKKSEVVFKELEKRLNGDAKDGVGVEEADSKDIIHVLAYQLKVFTQASMSKRIYVKKRVSNLLSSFDVETGDPVKLALNLFKAFDVELIDLYLDFLGFLTPQQAEKMAAFKDYFARNCAEDLMKKIEEQEADKRARNFILSELKRVLTENMSPCEMCTALLLTMEGREPLARYTFNLFPHTREHRPQVRECTTVAPPTAPENKEDANDDTLCDVQQTTADYEADHSSIGEDSDAMSVDLETPSAETEANEEIPIFVKPEPTIEQTDPLSQAIAIKTGEDSDSENTTSVLLEDDVKREDTTDWTKEEDRTILQVLQEHLTKEERKDRSITELLEEKNVYGMLFDSLDRSLCQIRERVLYLLTMLVVSESDN